MNRYLKRIIIGAFIIPLIGFLYIVSLVYFYDPLQLFNEKYPNKYLADTRIAAKRVIDNYEFDSVLLGSSMLLMSEPKELNNGKYINITLDGSISEERAYLLEYLFKTKNIKNIIYTLDGVIQDTSYYKKQFSYLYDTNIDFKDKIKAYFNGLIPYKCFLFFSKKDYCIGREHNYYNLQLEFFRPDYILDEVDFVYQKNLYTITNESRILDKYLVKYIEQNPKTNFHIVIPPYHILSYKKDLDKYLKLYKLSIEKLSKYKNVKIYFFGNERFSDNINNWQNDKQHYKKHINSRINKAINEGTNIITIDNMEKEFNKFIKKVEDYDLKAYKEALKLDIRE
ncbi:MULTISPECIES: hypothetical protein [unclassified Campylobacter]|uniref:hypothetical protein n=2 Tax=Campylobacter TaxID=194 RepID=UPI001D85CC0F|nr:hypothetical protein [Campylobacter sp. RM9331]MBZ8006286.1 hypothetical protein [Campylobacter sp. RM9332]